jgi:hypothetical protein
MLINKKTLKLVRKYVKKVKSNTLALSVSVDMHDPEQNASFLFDVDKMVSKIATHADVSENVRHSPRNRQKYQRTGLGIPVGPPSLFVEGVCSSPLEGGSQTGQDSVSVTADTLRVQKPDYVMPELPSTGKEPVSGPHSSLRKKQQKKGHGDIGQAVKMNFPTSSLEDEQHRQNIMSCTSIPKGVLCANN